MLVKDLINRNIPQLKPKDTVAKALQLTNDFRVTHLPIVSESKYLGLISEEDLLDLDEEDDQSTLDNLREHYIPSAADGNAHFLNAVNIALQLDSNIIPVTHNATEFEGVITANDLLRHLGNFAGCNEIGGLIVLKMDRTQFAISELSRIVESFDSTILHLNTTLDPLTMELTVTLHINRREISALVATFERYDYDVVFSSGIDTFENEISSNYDNLMKYLDI